MKKSVCELVRKGEEKKKGCAVVSIKTTSGRKICLCGGKRDAITGYTLLECHRCPLFVSRYVFVDERELAENGVLRPKEHVI